ncbi:uncharacterized protein LOC141904142 isoform X2 [Tubulanus polymorphus]|uniref:uncharacterized protein LOC141904142 isoform X2 n=1 Tax=Tubulanus polymorphus TaxID=672921 RepID=UPI003DA41C97
MPYPRRAACKIVDYSQFDAGDVDVDDDDVHDPSWQAPDETSPGHHHRNHRRRSRRTRPSTLVHSRDASPAETDEFSAYGSSERLRLRPWLVEQIDSGRYPGLTWLDDHHTLVQIPWKHGSRQGWRISDCCLFRNWAIHTGKFQKGRDKANPKRWKANFRCALNSLADIVEDKKLSRKKGCDAFKVYRFEPNKRKGPILRRNRQRVSSGGAQFDIEELPLRDTTVYKQDLDLDSAIENATDGELNMTTQTGNNILDNEAWSDIPSCMTDSDIPSPDSGLGDDNQEMIVLDREIEPDDSGLTHPVPENDEELAKMIMEIVDSNGSRGTVIVDYDESCLMETGSTPETYVVGSTTYKKMA